MTLHKRWLILDPEDTGSVPMERLLEIPELCLCPLFFQVLILVLQEDVKAAPHVTPLPQQAPLPPPPVAPSAGVQQAPLPPPTTVPSADIGSSLTLPPAPASDDGSQASPPKLVPFLVFCEAAAVFVGDDHHRKMEWAFRVYDADGDGIISDSDLACALSSSASRWPLLVQMAAAKSVAAAGGAGGWTPEEFAEAVDVEDLQNRMSIVMQDDVAVGPVVKPERVDQKNQKVDQKKKKR